MRESLFSEKKGISELNLVNLFLSIRLPKQIESSSLSIVNSGDTEAFLNEFTTDGAVDDWGSV